jgi:predicted DsbA family dithiol-disulfide isomerase
VSCKAAYLSRYGSVAGVPVAVGGIFFFTWVLILMWGSRGKSRIKDSAPAYIFAASTLALAVVLYLAYASFFVLKEVCPLCVATYVAVIGAFVISGGASSVPISKLPRRALSDMRVLVGTPVAVIIALLFVGGAAWATSAFPREEIRPVVPQAPAITANESTELERWWDVQPRVANFPFSNDGATVLIVEFADFQCPHCKQMYFAYKPILDKYLAEHPKDVKFVFKTWPINSNCNPTVPGVNFAASCDASAAFLMAAPKGTAEKLKDWFFLHQEELSPATIRRAAADVGRITDFDAQYPKVLPAVKADASVGSSLGVSGTPAFFVNGKRVPGAGVPPQYFDSLIGLELKRASAPPK